MENCYTFWNLCSAGLKIVLCCTKIKCFSLHGKCFQLKVNYFHHFRSCSEWYKIVLKCHFKSHFHEQKHFPPHKERCLVDNLYLCSKLELFLSNLSYEFYEFVSTLGKFTLIGHEIVVTVRNIVWVE